MRKLIIISALLLTTVQAQTPVRKFEWRMDMISSIPELEGFTYRYFLDTNTTGVILTGIVCTATAGPWTCTAPVPTTITGAHTVTLTAARDAKSEQSTKSPSYSFTDIVVPPAIPAIPTDFTTR